MERTDRNASDLNRPEWNSLEHNYDIHDIGEQFVRRHCTDMGFIVGAWGIDMRDDDESLIYDDKMDLKVYEEGSAPTLVDIALDESGGAHDALAGLVEVKTKRTDGWYGVINRRHLRKYVRHAHAHDVPAYIYMALVDDEDERIIRDTFIPIRQWDEYQRILDGESEYYDPTTGGDEQFLEDQIDDHPLVERTFRAPDGNMVVKLDTGVGLTWPEFTHSLYADGLGYDDEEIRQMGVGYSDSPSGTDITTTHVDESASDAATQTGEG